MNSWQLLGQMPGIRIAETGRGAGSGTPKLASSALLSSASTQSKACQKYCMYIQQILMTWVTRERARQPTSANLEESVKTLDGILHPPV
ncbi:hypothetical protein LT40_15260 [Pseudomonas rhizosphaerae]|uniref:Uncharacterized protein n=1 Tax=Pseudomonas rhizosphaerae TaxID=216142 RepID=A0A089YSQ2_9PSED|nr:hypothetical protein LT40_15260 [Pseudomonas rhizosphaerae]